VETDLLETDVKHAEFQDVKHALYHQTIVLYANSQKSYLIKIVLIYAQLRNFIELNMISTVNHVLLDAILVLMKDVSHVVRDINLKELNALTYVLLDKLKLMENAKNVLIQTVLNVIHPKRNVYNVNPDSFLKLKTESLTVSHAVKKDGSIIKEHVKNVSKTAKHVSMIKNARYVTKVSFYKMGNVLLDVIMDTFKTI
jgi:hypothetical protein